MNPIYVTGASDMTVSYHHLGLCMYGIKFLFTKAYY